MQTGFSDKQLNDAHIKVANDILRKCVHCGFCLATCPTYILLGDELDSPRGRIYQIRDMLENGKPRDGNIVTHLDRCLSCLSCMSTCPSGVDYMHLVDHARSVVEKTHPRPIGEMILRWLLALVLPNEKLFRFSLLAARLARPLAGMMPGRARVMLEMAPDRLSPAGISGRPGTTPSMGVKKARIGLMAGCAQKTLNPAINEATIRLLTRLGCEVVVPEGVGCCGALVHHMGKEEMALEQARANVAAWDREMENAGLDAIVINASGCGTTLKDYGHMLRNDPEWAGAAARVAALSRDITELVAELWQDNPPRLAATGAKPSVAYHSACSMQHGQKIKTIPAALLRQAGFDVSEPTEAHICCGSAGTYNIMQPQLASRLGERKARNLGATGAGVIAAGNIGCMVQIAKHGQIPVVHTAQLLDWATGGPRPAGMDD